MQVFSELQLNENNFIGNQYTIIGVGQQQLLNIIVIFM